MPRAIIRQRRKERQQHMQNALEGGYKSKSNYNFEAVSLSTAVNRQIKQNGFMFIPLISIFLIYINYKKNTLSSISFYIYFIIIISLAYFLLSKVKLIKI